MKRFFLIPVAAMLLGVMPNVASAHSRNSFFFGLNLGASPFNSFAFGYGGGRHGYRSSFAFAYVAPPIYYSAPPVYYAPPPTYYAPPQGYYAPQPTYYAPPQTYYAPPCAAPRYNYYYGGTGYYNYGR